MGDALHCPEGSSERRFTSYVGYGRSASPVLQGRSATPGGKSEPPQALENDELLFADESLVLLGSVGGDTPGFTENSHERIVG